MLIVCLVLKAVLRLTKISVCKELGVFLMKSATSVLSIFVVYEVNGRLIVLIFHTKVQNFARESELVTLD